MFLVCINCVNFLKRTEMGICPTLIHVSTVDRLTPMPQSPEKLSACFLADCASFHNFFLIKTKQNEKYANPLQCVLVKQFSKSVQ